MQRICIDNVFPVLITNRSHLREQFTQLLPVVITGTRKTQVILQIRPDLYLDEFVFVFSSWLLHYFYPQNNKNDPRSPQTCMHTSEQTERHANTESSTVWEMPFYNTKQVSSTTKQSALNQQRTLRCGKGPAAALREGALATQAIPSKEPGGASRSRGGSAQEALTHCSRTPASRRCSSTRSPACNLAVQWHGSLSPQRPQRLWAPCLSGLAGPCEPPHTAAFPSAPLGIAASHEATLMCVRHPLCSLLGCLRPAIPLCNEAKQSQPHSGVAGSTIRVTWALLFSCAETARVHLWLRSHDSPEILPQRYQDGLQS